MKMNKNNAGLEAEKLVTTFLANNGLKFLQKTIIANLEKKI
jgi:hypothetical protein